MNGVRAISTLPVPNEAAVGRTPFYRKVASELVARIRAGEFASDGALPTEAQLEKEFGGSRITIRSAMKEATSDGAGRDPAGPRLIRAPGARRRG